MCSRKFIVVTQLHERNNRGLIEYMESSRRDYGKALRLSMQSSVVISISRGIISIFKINTKLLVELQNLLFLMLKGVLIF